MKRIIVRVLGGEGIGYGHYYRCLSLAKALVRFGEGLEVSFIINSELKEMIKDSGFKFIIEDKLENDHKLIDRLDIDLFIFDSYLGNNEYLRKIKEKIKLMLIDDTNDIYDSSIPDILYNGNMLAEKVDYPKVEGQLKLLGLRYLIMKEEYWNNDVEAISDKKGVLITTGGTDEYGIMLNMLEKMNASVERIKVVIGPGYKDDYIKKLENIKTNNMEFIYKPSSLKEYIASSKIVITAGGSTVYEILSQKSIPVVFSIADNQDPMGEGLSRIGFEYLGKYPNIDYNKVIEIITNIKDMEYLDNEMFDLVDGSGAKSTVDRLLKEI